MAYLDGYIIPVPSNGKQGFIAMAEHFDALLIEHGARRVLECWGDNVPTGKQTDFLRAVEATGEETVVFSFVEWPDKATRDAAQVRMRAIMTEDERFDPAKNPMPFDGKRMVFGGFEPIVDLGPPASEAYVQGFVIPVPEAKREAYRKLEEDSWAYFRDRGAQRVVAAWQDDVPEGKQTDFFRSVAAEPGEKIVFAFLEWPSRAVCDAAAETMTSGDGSGMPDDMPFDGKRMIYGGFSPVVLLEK